MSIIQSIIYGFISGISEFLPVSSRAHQVLLRYVFGVDSRNFVQEFLVHIGILFSLIIGCREIIARLRREQSFLTSTHYRKKRKSITVGQCELRLLKSALLPLIIVLLTLCITVKKENNFLLIMALLLLNAIILLFADHSSHGDRDARTMSGFDGILMGVLGCLCVFPGLSRTGMISSYTMLRGVSYKNVANWAFLLGIPAIIIFIIFDIVGIITVGAGIISFSVLIGYILSGIAAFCGGYIAISVFAAILNRAGLTYFTYYSIGLSLITFILYLIS